MDPAHAKVHTALNHAKVCFFDFEAKMLGGSLEPTPDFCKGVEFQGLSGQEGECVMTIRISALKTVIDIEHCAPE